MKKVFLVLTVLTLTIGFVSCETESTVETDQIYGSDKEEEPDRVAQSDKDEEPDGRE